MATLIVDVCKAAKVVVEKFQDWKDPDEKSTDAKHLCGSITGLPGSQVCSMRQNGN
jgi:hypothetical protein